MRAKLYSFLADPPKLFHAEHLVAAGVGQDRAGPAHETMEPSRFFDHVPAGPKIEVIRIADNELNSQFLEVLGEHCFHSTLRPDRREDGRLDNTVRRS